jgi:hypothetical protein
MQTGDNIQIVMHVWRAQIAWYVLIRDQSGRRYIAARGMAEREIEPVLDTYGAAVMAAAYEAYRVLGE